MLPVDVAVRYTTQTHAHIHRVCVEETHSSGLRALFRERDLVMGLPVGVWLYEEEQENKPFSKCLQTENRDDDDPHCNKLD